MAGKLQIYKLYNNIVHVSKRVNHITPDFSRRRPGNTDEARILQGAVFAHKSNRANDGKGFRSHITSCKSFTLRQRRCFPIFTRIFAQKTIRTVGFS